MAKKFMLVSLAAAVLAAPSFASAQNAAAYDYRGYNPDTQCQQKVNNQRTAGGIIGALAGAAIGSNVAGRGVRTEGAVLGAVVGAVAGSQIGKNNAACDDRYQYERGRYDNRNYSYNNREHHHRDRDRNRDDYYDNSSYQSYGNRYPSYQASYSIPTSYGRDNCGWGSANYQTPDGRWTRESVYMCRRYDGSWVVTNR
ncbi:MAG: glycine zipper 2TM domain-containing protein [Caulobacterales bacterium]|nr:glycine zipper 2TM domain-containing protein [Caulobacterales bacterium]MCA0372868.1 glycine zipper 2TM domain-containing protein [Pseudomonadota bacterium]